MIWLLALLLIPVNCFGFGVNSPDKFISEEDSSTNLVVGYSTIGIVVSETISTSRSRKIVVTVPTGGISLSHMYFYGYDPEETARVWFSVFETDGTVITTWKGPFYPTSTIGWVGGLLAVTPFELAAGDYAFQFYSDEDIFYAWDDAGTGNAFGTTAATMATTTSVRLATLIGANYAAR